MLCDRLTDRSGPGWSESANTWWRLDGLWDPPGWWCQRSSPPTSVVEDWSLLDGVACQL